MQRVLENGGAAVTKYVVDTVLTPLLPPGTMALVGPILNTMIENRIDLVNGLIDAAKRGDAAQAAQIVTEGYLVFQFEVPCTLLGDVIPGMPDSFKEATCGTVGKIIAAAGGAMSDVVKYVESLFSDPEKIFDLPGDAIAKIGHIATGTDNVCAPPAEYYAYKFAVCYAAGEAKKISSPATYAGFSSSLEWNCHRYYEQCMTSDSYRKICGGLQRTFDQQEEQLDQGVRAAAATYAREVRNYVTKSGGEICDPGYSDWAYNDFIRNCSVALNKQIPLAGAADDTVADNKTLARNCVPSQPQFATVNVADQACRAAVTRSDFDRFVDRSRQGFMENGNLMRCMSTNIPQSNPGREALKTLPRTEYSMGDALPMGSGSVRAILGNPVPSPGVSPDALMPTNRRGGVTEIDPIPTVPTKPWWTNRPDPPAFGTPRASSSGTNGSFSPSAPMPLGGVAARPPQNSSGIYGPYAPNNMSSSGAYPSYTPKTNSPTVPSGSAVASPPMSSSGAYPSYTPKDNAATVPSGGAVARPPMSSSGASMSYTPKDAPQPSGGAATKQTSLSNSNQIDPGTKICKIRPIHRSSSANNAPAPRQLGPANVTVMKPTNNAASGVIRGTRFRKGDPK